MSRACASFAAGSSQRSASVSMMDLVDLAYPEGPLGLASEARLAGNDQPPVVRLLLEQPQELPQDVGVAVLPVHAPRPIVARVPVGHEDAVRPAAPEHPGGDGARARLPEPVERDVLREEPVYTTLHIFNVDY